MSRVVVKNLPNDCTKERLKEKFSVVGAITDLQLKHNKDGKFRRIAHIGFDKEESADKAIHLFDKCYIDSTRITVECWKTKTEIPRSWSKHSEDSSSFKKLHITNKINKEKNVLEKTTTTNPIKEVISTKLSKLKNEQHFLEFMEVHSKDKTTITEDELLKPKVKNSVASNDRENNVNSPEDELKKIAFDDNISDLDYLKLKTGKLTTQDVEKIKNTKRVNFYTLKISGLPYNAKKKSIKKFFKPLKVDSIRVPIKIKGIAYIGFINSEDANKAMVKDKSFIEGKQISIHKYRDNNAVNQSELLEEPEKWKKQRESLLNEESVAESGRIFVRNLPYNTTEQELKSIFEKYGSLIECNVPFDSCTRKIKGFCFVTYMFPQDAHKAYSELDGTLFHGRMLHLMPAKEKKSDDSEVNEKSSFKNKKQEKLKSEANSSYNWNTLFLGVNAIANVMASTYNTSKESFLTDNNAAVRLALGETKLVNETKEFLESNGVQLDAFNREVSQRSNNVILVKNLPAATTVDEIRDIFVKYGLLGRVLLPNSGVTALVEFIEPAEARNAFKKVGYTRFKNLPLYLEWAPEGTFTTAYEENIHKELNVKKIEEPEDIADDMEPETNTTLFIKNLNFETTEENIRKHFKNCGKIVDVTIAKKKDPKKAGILSMGYGFIQFYTQNSVNNALKTLQLSTLDGHRIELKRSNRTVQGNTHVTRKSNNVEKQSGNKIIVRNIPFEATQSEIRDLFVVFGELKQVRLPLKMAGTGPHRGFAFVEYVSKEDAKNALKALCQSTHLYGRRLVLEWAKSSDDDVNEMRKRTANQFVTDEVIRSKKSKSDIVIGDHSDDEDSDAEDD